MDASAADVGHDAEMPNDAPHAIPDALTREANAGADGVALGDGASADGGADAAHDAPTAEAGSIDASEDETSLSFGDACSVTGHATAARSAGFAGTSSDYFALFDRVPCNEPSDCVASCTGAGGTTASCEQGSQCLTDLCPDGGSGCIVCLPPTYWLNPEGALGQPGSGITGAPANDVQAFDNGYNDPLEVTGFHVVVPAGASVRGVAFLVDRSADDDSAADESVRILKSGTAVGTDHARTDHWPAQSYAVQVYGGPGDTWGTAWTPGDVQAADFGISITPQYLTTGGNDRVFIDSVVVVVYYAGSAECP